MQLKLSSSLTTYLSNLKTTEYNTEVVCVLSYIYHTNNKKKIYSGISTIFRKPALLKLLRYLDADGAIV